MTKLEEQATKSWNERYPEGDEQYKDAQIDGFIAGAEFAHKEITTQAKKWLKNNYGKIWGVVEYDMPIDDLLSNLETDMNEHWEENTTEKKRVPNGQTYWWINEQMEICHKIEFKEHSTKSENLRFVCGNYFHTEKEAEAMANKLRTVLQGGSVMEDWEKEILQSWDVMLQTKDEISKNYSKLLKQIKDKHLVELPDEDTVIKYAENVSHLGALTAQGVKEGDYAQAGINGFRSGMMYMYNWLRYNKIKV